MGHQISFFCWDFRGFQLNFLGFPLEHARRSGRQTGTPSQAIRRPFHSPTRKATSARPGGIGSRREAQGNKCRCSLTMIFDTLNLGTPPPRVDPEPRFSRLSRGLESRPIRIHPGNLKWLEWGSSVCSGVMEWLKRGSSSGRAGVWTSHPQGVAVGGGRGQGGSNWLGYWLKTVLYSTPATPKTYDPKTSELFLAFPWIF